MIDECPYSITLIRDGMPDHTIHFDKVRANDDGSYTLSQTIFSGYCEYTQGDISFIQNATTSREMHDAMRDALENKLNIAPADWVRITTEA